MNHDAAMAVVDGTEILWAAHAERYSKVKNDHYLNQKIVDEAMTYGPFDKVVYYEKPLLKKMIINLCTNNPSLNLTNFGLSKDKD